MWCPVWCNRLAECGAAKGVGVKAGGDPEAKSPGACGGGNKGSVNEVSKGFAINDIAKEGQHSDKEIHNSTITSCCRSRRARAHAIVASSGRRVEQQQLRDLDVMRRRHVLSTWTLQTAEHNPRSGRRNKADKADGGAR